MDKDYLRALPALRFFGALFLVLFHLHVYGFMAVRQPQLLNLVSKGYVGTSLFFVISGFVMTHLYAQTAKLSPATFYWKRLTRILPPYLLGLLLGIPILLFGAMADPHPVALLGQLILYLTALQAWVYGQAFVFDGPGWSVSVLVFFYLLFPLLRTWVLKLSIRAVVCISVLLWLVYMVPPVVFMLITPGPTVDDGSLSLSFLKTFPLFRLPELVLGMMAAAIYQRRLWQQAFSQAGTVWGCVGLLLAIMALVPEPNPVYPLLHNGLLTPLLMACVLSMAYHRGVLARLGTRAWVQWLGNASLNIFLLHVPLFTYYGHLLPGDQKHWTSIQVLGYLLILALLSLAVETFVTAPLMRRLRTFNGFPQFSRKARNTPVLVVSSAGVHSQQLESRKSL